MSDEKKTNENSTSVFVENMAVLMSPEGVQKYILGSKKNGTPRALYDVVKDYTKPKKKNKKKNKKKGKKDDMNPTAYSFYLNTKKGKKKNKKKNKKSDKYWHI